ncbi:hypothetical protein SALBM311S_03386 [Streptomyces alboniger]
MQACRELFGNPGQSHPDAWPMQHPVWASVVYSVLIIRDLPDPGRAQVPVGDGMTRPLAPLETPGASVGISGGCVVSRCTARP